MKNFKKLLFTGFLMLCFSAIQAQVTIVGKVMDTQLNSPLPGANVSVPGGSTSTDIDGNFEITSNATSGNVTISFIGYVTKTVAFSGTSGQTVNLGEISVATDASQLDEVVVIGRGIIDLANDRKTPIAVSNLTAQEIQDKVGSSDITQTMVNTPSVYVAGQAGGFGDSRIVVRGFGQDNTAFLLNGQPINGMEDGLMYWSNWSGMADIANMIQIQRGLGSSKLAISSVGGTVNFITKATSMREGGFISAGVANDDYLKTTVAYNSGLMNSNFGVSVMLTHWQGDGYNAGTRGEGQNYFISFGYKPSDKHNFNFLITGAPQRHDQNFTKRLSDYKTYGRKYNNNWGTLNGEYLSERTNFYHKPVANLNWDWIISDKSELSTVLYASWGRGGGTGNYGASAIRANGQINWDAIVDRNEAVGNGVQGDGQSYLIRSSVNNHSWYGLVSNFEHQINQNLTLNVGADLRTYYGTHYRQVNNFLGLNNWTETRGLRDFSHQIAQPNVPRTVTEHQRIDPWLSTFNAVGEGQRIDYDNSERISYGGLFGQVEYATDKFSTFFQGAISTQSHQRFDRYDYLPEAEDSEKVNNVGYNLKAGGSFNINEQNSVYVNAGYYSRQPYHDNIYLNFTNQINPLTENEKILGLEAGYSFKSRYFSANLNAYRTSWKDRVTTNSRVAAASDLETYPSLIIGDQIFTTNQGVEQLHQGLELDFTAKPFTLLDLRGFVSVGNWEYQGNSVNVIRDENRNVLAENSRDVDGGKVGDAAQFTAGAGFVVRPAQRFSIDADYRFYDNLYSNVGAVKDNLQLPSFGIVDAGISYKLLLGEEKNESLNFRLNVNNLFHEIYISETRTNVKATDRINPTSTTDFSTYESAGRLINGLADANQGFYGLGRTWNFTIRYNF
ncbi:TonB-dependent receptor plug domain-containing protein [Flavobacterium sp. NST-5]|uniref:TonB-dependent receptor plug domain-containing protein n=1 Tax=Flavobacterium ichthyis TaxID=2698827 RepID=A0ABW9ZA38_9FLAO|nr:carboxypeptidase-like regulatory domain-containing protein [Flavobacterium ichthyis]NBL65474.1 TonB-dependent receptor plug domain-containing protein [Flavobacterium ichthyis]